MNSPVAAAVVCGVLALLCVGLAAVSARGPYPFLALTAGAGAVPFTFTAVALVTVPGGYSVTGTIVACASGGICVGVWVGSWLWAHAPRPKRWDARTGAVKDAPGG